MSTRPRTAPPRPRPPQRFRLLRRLGRGLWRVIRSIAAVLNAVLDLFSFFDR
ncbi:hypothetical protein [Deinococcus altitudinis]|uniref:hypothetical protein n=1 Tax=Deinococcus altitudinis TaxID=468914 RepID=UPI0038924F46